MSDNDAVVDVPENAADRLLAEAGQAECAAHPDNVLAEVRRLGVSTPAEAAEIVRADRDGHDSGLKLPGPTTARARRPAP